MDSDDDVPCLDTHERVILYHPSSSDPKAHLLNYNVILLPPLSLRKTTIINCKGQERAPFKSGHRKSHECGINKKSLTDLMRFLRNSSGSTLQGMKTVGWQQHGAIKKHAFLHE